MKYSLTLLFLLCAYAAFTQKPTAQFEVNQTQGLLSDTFRFSDLSVQNPTQYNWQFTPATVTFLNNTNAGSKNPNVRFNSATNYSVKLIVSNAGGSDTLVKQDYIQTFSYDVPGSLQPIENADGSIGVSRLKLANADTLLNPFAPVYALVQGNQQALLFRGKKQAISVYRPANTTPADVKAWIDFNRNGQFESGELVLNKTSSTQLICTDTVLIPSNQKVGYTYMRVLVALSSGNVNPTVSTLGVYRDFRVNFGSDNIKPTISLNSSNVLYGEVGKTFIDPMATAIDNLEGNISHRVQRIGTIDTSNVGSYTLKYFVSDLYGNTSDTLTRQVFITLNQTAPVINLLGDSIVKLNIHQKFIEPGYTAFDNASNNLTSFVVVTGNLDTANTGTYVLYYTVTDAFNRTSFATRLVQVIDSIKPFITPLKGNPYVHLVLTPINLESLIKVNDNSLKLIQPLIYGNVNTSVLGSTQIVYKAFDWTGNAADSFVLQVQVADTLAPVLTDTTLLRPRTIDPYQAYTDLPFTFTDNFYPENTLVTSFSGFVDNSYLGEYTRTVTCTDPSGNKANYSFKVSVVDRNKPTITLFGANPFNTYANQWFSAPGYFIQDNFDNTFILEDNLKIITNLQYRYNFTHEFFAASPGIYFIKLVTKDGSNNISDTATRLVNVSLAPTGISVVDAYSLNIYPNPANNFVWVEPKTDFGTIEEIQFMNAAGQALIVNKENINGNYKVITEGLLPGYYTMVITGKSGNEYRQKLLITP